ncbi:hypothetical protein BJ741DRAFT_322670 [Chytriomyces cf. hyalinus JEL632]|nr:hypothetical protein BJ741DRAFT_322670 [Chytriomyces cf. hyalinus JEL632]
MEALRSLQPDQTSGTVSARFNGKAVSEVTNECVKNTHTLCWPHSREEAEWCLTRHQCTYSASVLIALIYFLLFCYFPFCSMQNICPAHAFHISLLFPAKTLRTKANVAVQRIPMPSFFHSRGHFRMTPFLQILQTHGPKMLRARKQTNRGALSIKSLNLLTDRCRFYAYFPRSRIC